MGKTSDAVAEGVSIASAAARLTVRNHILVETIAHDESFDPAQLAPFAQEWDPLESTCRHASLSIL